SQTQTEAADQPVPDLLTNQLEISEAPTTVVSGEKPVPPHIRPTEALADIIRLAQSGVEESVMLAYITNSLHTFSLGPEEIIYLAVIGLSSGFVTAMLKHDRAFIENAFIPSPTPLAPEPTALPAEQPAEPEPLADAAQYPTEAPVSEPTEPDFHDAL